MSYCFLIDNCSELLYHICIIIFGRDYLDEVKYNNDTVKVLLDTAKSEYSNEHNRTSVIDSKTSIALPIISTYCLALAQMNDYKAIFTTEIKSFKDLLIPSCLFLTFTISLLLTLISVIMMVKVIKMRDYYVIKVEDLYDNDYFQEEPLFLSIKLIELYIEATELNKSGNDNRIPLYKKGWVLTVVSIVLFVTYVIVKNYVS